MSVFQICKYKTIYVIVIKPYKIQASVNGIRTYNFCDTGTVLYQLSYQANATGTGHFVSS